MSYVEEIQEDEYQDVPSDDSWTDNDEGKDKTLKPDEAASERESETASAISDQQQSDNKSLQSENKNNTLTNDYTGFLN